LKVGVPSCPTCRSVIRVDFDSQNGRLIFSKEVQMRVEYCEAWKQTIEEKLESVGLNIEDGLGMSIGGQADLAKFSVEMQNGRQVPLGQILKAADPNDPHHERVPQLFPLTFTLHEYVIAIDNSGANGLPSVEDVFDCQKDGNLVVRADSVLRASLWKDQTSGVQLHPNDRVLEVNGVGGSAEELLEQLRKAEMLNIKVRQTGSLIQGTVYDQNNPTRERLTKQTKPRQIELLRECGAKAQNAECGFPVNAFCVCGGALEHLGLRNRIHRLVEPKDDTGVMRVQNRSYSVDDLIKMNAVTCDLCSTPVSDEVWTCENGESTILHAQSFDICCGCIKTYTGERERDRQLRAQQDAEFNEALQIDEQQKTRKAEEEAKKSAEEAAKKLAAETGAADKIRRKAEFDRLHPPPGGQPHVAVRIRATDGSHQQRCFAIETKISSLFEFVTIAEWRSPLPSKFDLVTTFPKRSLHACAHQTLQEADLGSSVLLCVTEGDV